MNIETCGGPLQGVADQSPPDAAENDYSFTDDWIVLGNKRPIECHVYVLQEEDGGFSTWAARLPGVASQGQTEDEAIAGFSEAFCGACETYMSRGESIPWLEAPQDRPAGVRELWIVVDA